jgi:DNA-binding FrmR family transcriptional regulator
VSNGTVSQEVLNRRLRRIEGQVRGVQKMIADGRDCENIITQLAAVRAAIESVGAMVINNCMKLNLSSDTGAETSGIDSLARAVCIWGGVRIGGKTVKVGNDQ